FSRLASFDWINPAAWRSPCIVSSASFGEPITETYTLACCRSPETSVRVTVTFLTRGSRSSKRMVSLATSRMTSATRASRCSFMAGPPRSYFEFVVEQLGRGVGPECLDDLAQSHLDVMRLVADLGHPQDGQLAAVLGLDLRHRHVKVVVQLVLDALDH